MNKFKLFAVLMMTPLFMACSKGPSDSEVEALIEEQYKQTESIMDDAMGSAGGDNAELKKAMGEMMAGMMPKLESVDEVNCDSAEGENTYLCTATLTQTINGKSRTDKASFKVHKVNDEWVLRP